MLGAAGGIGQPMSMLLKMSPQVSDLSLFDIVNTPGVAADLSHISTPAPVTGFVGNDQVEDAVRGASSPLPHAAAAGRLPCPVSVGSHPPSGPLTHSSPPRQTAT